MSAFDGAGKPYKGLSLRGVLTVMVVSVVIIAGLWLAMIRLMNEHPGALQNPPAMTQQQEPNQN
jgi:hypothetical protein